MAIDCRILPQQIVTGPIPQEDDGVRIWYQSCSNCTWSSVCYAVVGVSALLLCPAWLTKVLQHAVFYACVLLPGLHVYAHLDACDQWGCMWPCGTVHAVAHIRGEGFPCFDTIAWMA
jgi:hypothetical protein